MNPANPSTLNREPSTQLLVRRNIHPCATIPSDSPGAVIDFRSSDESLDRYSERISVAGWQLDNYRKNPVVQNAHSYSSLSDTIGKSLITEVRPPLSAILGEGPGVRATGGGEGAYLYQRILFAIEENPMAKVAYGLYKGGFLSAVSVGFIPLQWEDFPDKSSSSSSSSSSSVRRKYIEQELVEVSAVSIPANPNALTLALKSGAVEAGDVRELFALLKHFCSSGTGVPPVSGHSSAGVPPASSSENPKSEIRNPKFSNPADRIPDTSALGSAIDEAQSAPRPSDGRGIKGEGLLHLTKQLNEIRAVLRRA